MQTLSLEHIKKPIVDEFALFETCYQQVFATDNPVLAAIFEHLAKSKGKQLRPVLLLLTAKLCGTPNERTIYSAVVLELLHLASLVHDDVVDNTLQRRGIESVNALVDNQRAVLAGDYLLAQCMRLSCERLSSKISSQAILADLVSELSSGELLQMHYAEQLAWNRERYFQIIRKKTAALFSCCTKLAAVSVDADSALVEKMVQLGEWLGICFQIRDDIFDYSPQMHTGKPSLHDIREGKMTLPLIVALQNASDEERTAVYDFVRAKDFSEANLARLSQLVEKYDGIETAEREMAVYQQRVRALLNEFPDSESKEALLLLTDYFGSRTK